MEILFPLAFGVIFGFVIQKGYLCCYEGLTTALAIKNYRVLRVTIWSILTAMLGFHILSGLGALTIITHPFFWPATIIGGILFGIGMILVGGCMFGVLLKTASGLLNYFVVLGGIFLGLLGVKNLILHSKINGLYKLALLEQESPAPTLASFLGMNSWVVVVFLSLLLIWLLYQFRDLSGINKPAPEKISFLLKIFKRRWPDSITGIITGILVIIGFARWKIFTLPTFFRYTSSFDSILIHLAPFLWFILVMAGVLGGMAISAILGGEFRIRWDKKNTKESSLMFLGGLTMGAGMALANGCNINHIFTLIPQLSLGSFLFIIIISIIVWLKIKHPDFLKIVSGD
jgi:uncharacterized membrane protein YedE/YeeE